MENNNLDWMAVQTQVGDSASFADIYNLGVDPSAVTLDTKSTYKDKKKIKENPNFQTNGKFDDKKFDQYYDMSVQTLNAYKSSDYSIGSGNVPDMNLWEDTGLARALKQKTFKDPISIKINKDPSTNLKIAQKSNLGFIDLNQWSDPQKSIAEVAQGQKVLDGITGKELDFTPEDNSIGNAFGFFNEPLVLSAYDKDETDEDGNIIHKRGETKFDAKGLPRYETLSGRNASGKQILSRLDTLTKEDSYINKFDFMDSDDLDKSLGGSIMKTAVNLIPLALGGPIATAAKAYFIADGLLQAGTEIGKALTGIFGGPDADKTTFYKSLNNIQSFTKQWKGGTSEYAKNNFASMENLLNLASDSVYQLMGQQALAMWPQRIKQYQIAKELNLNPSLLGALSKGGDEAVGGVLKFQNYVAKYGDEAGAAAIAMSKNINAIDNISKYAKYGSRAFMAATSAVGISDVGDQAGLNARDKGWLYLGYTAGLAPLFAANVGHWVEGGHEIDELAHGMNGALKKYAGEYLAPIVKTAEQEAAEVASAASKDALTGLAKFKGNSLEILKAGRDLGARVAKRFENINTPLMAGLAEGVEEVTEEALQDGVKIIYNGLSDAGLTSTDNKKIDFNIEDTMSRYGQAFVGGAVGGMIFKLVDPDIKTNPFISDEMKEYVANGYGDKVISQIKDMASKGQLGSKELSINKHMNVDGILENDVWAPVNKDNPVSQNDFIADRMIKEVKANMDHLKAFSLDDPNFITDSKNKFYDTLVDTRTDTDLRDRVRGASDKLIELNRELKNIDETDINAEAIKKKKDEIKKVKEEFQYLTSDESVDEYFRQGLFNINTEINSKFGVKTRQKFTEELIGSKNIYTLLNSEDKTKVDAAFDDYRLSNNDTYGIKVDLRNARLQAESFDNDMKEHGGYEAIENYNESLETLANYVKAGKGLVDGKETENTLVSLSNDFYENMKDVKYIPDFIHDEINKRLTEIKENGLINSISNNASKRGIEMDVNTLRNNLLDGGIKGGLNESTPIHKLFKSYLSKFKPINVFDSPAYLGLKESEQPSLSGMIKVLSEVDDLQDNSEEKNLYDMRKELIDSLTPEQIRQIIITASRDLQYDMSLQSGFEELYSDVFEAESEIDMNTKGEILNLLNDANFEDILLKENIDDLQINDGLVALKLLHNINKQHFLAKATGEATNYDFNILSRSKDNVLLNHALDNTLNDQAIGLTVKEYGQIDSEVDEIIGKIEAASKDKATSPLATFLSDSIRFKNEEFEKVLKLGASNYVNNSDDFSQTLEDHIDKAEKVNAYMLSIFKLNPIINQWRKDHADIVPENLRNEILTEITPQGFGTIYQNADFLLNELRYLRDLNDFNKNNTLAKLLKEDGKQLSASFRTLQKLISIPELANNLPSLTAFINDETVKEYTDDIEKGTDEDKIAALALAAKYEHDIFTEFQALNDGIKQNLIDLTFKPINSGSYQFRSNVTADAPLNDMHQTLYLAKIFGSSSIEYTKAVGGEKTIDGYQKIIDAQMDPFPAQESAIRLAYLNRYGDPQVYESLVTAFAYKNEQEPPNTFRRGDSQGIDLKNILTIIGDPGVGKTKAIIAGILSLDEGSQDTVVLGSVNEHVDNLKSGITNAGFSDRINTDLSNNLKEFIKSLELADVDNKILTLDSEEERILKPIDVIKSYTYDYKGDAKIAALLNNVTGEVMKGVKLVENNGKFNELLSKKLKGVKNIIIDEFTHANPIDIAIITNIVNAYNKSINNDPNLKITITLAGDNNQLGFSLGGTSRTFADFMQVPTSVPLTTSLRSGWDLVNNTLIEVKDRTSQLNDMTSEQVSDPIVASRMKQVPIKLNYTTSNGKPIGIYREVSSGETTSAQLRFFNEHVNAIKSSEKSLVYVVQNDESIPAAEALLREMLGSDWKTYGSVLTATNTQGREYKYAIVDAAFDQTGELYKVRRAYKFLNTMLSRATESTLLIDKGDFDPYVSWTQLEVPKAIDQKKLTDDMIVRIKENRQNIISAILDQSVEETADNTDNTKNTAPEEPTRIETLESKRQALENTREYQLWAAGDFRFSGIKEDIEKLKNISGQSYNSAIIDIFKKVRVLTNAEKKSFDFVSNGVTYTLEYRNRYNSDLFIKEPNKHIFSIASDGDVASSVGLRATDLLDIITDARTASFDEALSQTKIDAINAKFDGQLIALENSEPTLDSELGQSNITAEQLPSLNATDTEALLNSNDEVSNVIVESEATDDFARTSPYMVNSYTDFTYKRDVDTVRSLLGDMSDADAERALFGLKEFLTYKDFDKSYFNNNPLFNSFRTKGYSAKNMEITIRAIKRSADFMPVGRANWKSSFKPELQQDLLIAEATLVSKTGAPPVTFTISTFNSLENIRKYGGDTEGVKSFLAQATAGLARNQEWTLPTKFSIAEWKDFTSTKEFKINFKKGVSNVFGDLKNNYKDNMTITDPQVIIAKQFNSGSLSHWKDLTGKSVAFVTEHASLRSKNPMELYAIYSKQLEYFNNDQYRALDYNGKKEFENSKPLISGTQLRPRPGLVKMFKLNNPTHTFVEFVTNYNIFEAKRKEARKNRQTLNLQDEVREFEMSPYVADRLVKSMMLLHRMLTDENSATNRQWFEQNVMPNVKGNVLNQINDYIAYSKAEAIAQGDDMSNFFTDVDSGRFISTETDATALRTVDDLVDHLDKFLYGNDKLVRGVYNTQKAEGFQSVDLKQNVDLRTILPSTLSTEKWKDFSQNGILNVKNLSIYNGLKPSFLKMIDESFKALGSLSLEGAMGKYSLNQVFKDGKIENIIVAGVGANGRNLNNVIAPVLKTSLTNGYTTNAINIQSASFYIDFDKMISKAAELAESGTKPVEQRQIEADAERLATDKTFKTILATNKITADYLDYNELFGKSFANKAELETFMNQGIQTPLKSDVKVTDINKAYWIDTNGKTRTFRDHLLDEKLLTYNLSDNGDLVTLVAEYDDKVQTTTFDKNNSYNPVLTEVYKQSEVFNATDEAKKFIDANGLTKENLTELAIKNKARTIAFDFTPLKGTLISFDGKRQLQIVGSALGPSGTIEDSFVSLIDPLTGERIDRKMEMFPETITSNLEPHPRAEQKNIQFKNDPKNIDYTSTLIDVIQKANIDLTFGEVISIANKILTQFELTDGESDFRKDESIYEQMLNTVSTNSNNLIVSPWDSDSIPEGGDVLLDAYQQLAKGLYTDNLHNANDFVNNFSIFADGSWEQYQKTIDEIVNSATPEMTKAILKLEEQLNKLTHDC